MFPRIVWWAALFAACASEPQVSAPEAPLFEVIPVDLARGRAGVILVSIGSSWFSTPRHSPRMTRRQPSEGGRWEVQFERVRLLVGDVRLGRVVAEVGGRRVLTTVARDPRTYLVEWSDEDPGAAGAALPLTAFALLPDAPPDAWTATYTVSFDVGPVPTRHPIRVARSARQDLSLPSDSHEIWMWFHDAPGRTPDLSIVGFAGGYLRVAAPASYLDCANPRDGDDAYGARLRRDGPSEVELTFHADHLFWTALRTEDQRAAIELIAQAPRANSLLGVFVDESLRGVSVVGGHGPGDLPLTTNGVGGVRTLLDFVTENVRTAIHLNGNGRCTVRPRATP